MLEIVFYIAFIFANVLQLIIFDKIEIFTRRLKFY